MLHVPAGGTPRRDASTVVLLSDAGRQGALLSDAPLSDAGRQGAADAREAIMAFCNERGVPQPTLVLTSPLQRALQTAALLFPEHPNVVVREELRERRTGLTCSMDLPDLLTAFDSCLTAFDRL